MEFKRADFKCDWGSQFDIIGIYGLGDKRNAEAPLCRRRSEIGQHTPASETTTRKDIMKFCQSKTTPRLSRIPISHTKPKKNPPVPRLKYGRDGGRGGEGVVSVDTASVSMPNCRQPFHLHDDNRQPTLDPTRIPPRHAEQKRPNFVSHTPPFTAAAAAAIARARAHISKCNVDLAEAWGMLPSQDGACRCPPSFASQARRDRRGEAGPAFYPVEGTSLA